MIRGRGENICTSRVEGGGGAGATREALSRGRRAAAGEDNPSGDEPVWLAEERKVRLGLVGCGMCTDLAMRLDEDWVMEDGTIDRLTTYEFTSMAFATEPLVSALHQ